MFCVPRLRPRLPVFLPGGVRTGEGNIAAVPRRAVRINTQTEEKQKTKESSFIACEMLRRLGRDSVKVVVRGSTVLAGYRSDVALSAGIKELAKPVYVTLKSLLSVRSVPRERESEMRVLSDCLRTFLCFSYFL